MDLHILELTLDKSPRNFKKDSECQNQNMWIAKCKYTVAVVVVVVVVVAVAVAVTILNFIDEDALQTTFELYHFLTATK